ncbi:hypothetical protein C8Q78DRAFT_549308 [Trametes maxima]|nr:hypothetical protein C8Q78DRAFT_549308 [Trametes maxima]
MSCKSEWSPTILTVAPFVGSLLFGILTVLYPVSIWLLFFRDGHRNRTRLRVWMASITTTMYILAAMHLAFSIIQSVHGSIFGITRDGVPELPMVERAVYGAKPVILTLLTLAGDGFMAYRVFIVWNRNKYILSCIICLLLGSAVAGLAWAMDQSISVSGNPPTYNPPGTVTMRTVFVPVSLTTNLTTTSLLLGRLMWSHRKRSKFYAIESDSSLQWRVMKIVLLSETVYSLVLITDLILLYTCPSAADVTLDALSPLIGISFTMIIIGVGLHDASTTIFVHATESFELSHGPPSVQRYRGTPPIAVNVQISRTDDCTNLGSTSMVDRNFPSKSLMLE